VNDKDSVVLVDKSGRDLLTKDGIPRTMEKLAAHQQGVLHKAVSVFIFNRQREFLLQKRATHKYHSPGKWTNTCCTHPFPGEKPIDAARRRLKEEMGLSCELVEAFTFSYKAEVGNGLVENEFDHVFVGFSNASPVLNPEEASDWRWITAVRLSAEISEHPEMFTPWLRIIYKKAVSPQS
jgi:isopentenyl-diphosphate Delta-isomerase